MVLWTNCRLAHDEDHEYDDDESAWALTTKLLTDRLHAAERARDDALAELAHYKPPLTVTTGGTR